MKRKDVFKLINEEREYQKERYPKTVKTDPTLSTSDWLIIIKNYIREAENHIHLLDKPSARESIRKIAAICVACMEHKETKSRKIKTIEEKQC